MGVDSEERSKSQPVLFGWCLKNDEHHKQCRKQFVDTTGVERQCSCSCHQESTKNGSRRTPSKT